MLYTEARPCPSPPLQRLEKQQHVEETSRPLAMSGLDLSLPHARVRRPYCIKHCRDMSQEPISFGYPRPLQDIPKGASSHLACCCLLLRYQGLGKPGAHLLAIEGLVLTFQLDQVHLNKWKPHTWAAWLTVSSRASGAVRELLGAAGHEQQPPSVRGETSPLPFHRLKVTLSSQLCHACFEVIFCSFLFWK